MEYLRIPKRPHLHTIAYVLCQIVLPLVVDLSCQLTLFVYSHPSRIESAGLPGGTMLSTFSGSKSE